MHCQPQVTSIEFSSVIEASDTYSGLLKNAKLAVINFQFISVLNNCSKIFKFIRPIHDQVFSI